MQKRLLEIRKVAKKLPSNLWKAPGEGITCQNLIIPGGMVHRHFALCYKLLLPLHLYKEKYGCRYTTTTTLVVAAKNHNLSSGTTVTCQTHVR